MDKKYYNVSGTVSITKEDVLNYLKYEDDNYEPTKQQWENCAKEMFKANSIYWHESILEEKH